jgi:hypothetical protein
MDSKMKKGQVTIFIILAIVLIVAIISVLLLVRKGDSENTITNDPKSFVQKCVRDAISDDLPLYFKNGGILDPQKNIMYDGENLTYLCYQPDYYFTCYNLYPIIEERIENDLLQNTRSKVQECFNVLRDNLDKSGYDVSGGPTNYSIDLLPGQIKVLLKKKIDLTKGASSMSVEDFSFVYISPLYEMINVAREIVNEESQDCYFEYNGFTLLYPDYKIMRIDYDGSKIYKITDRTSGKELKFAVRSCVFPPGI